jgi:hypothetical protein
MKILRALKRILSLVLVLAISLTLTPALPESVMAAAEPVIMRHPSDAVYSKSAVARFYVSASSVDSGYLTYQWYRSGPYPAPVTSPNPLTLGGTPIGSGTKAVLTVTTPDVTGTVYY